MKKIIFSTLLLSVLSFAASAQAIQKNKTPQPAPKTTTTVAQKPSTATTVKKSKAGQSTVMTRPKHKKHSHKVSHKKSK